jgi:hypothetical protein
MTDGPQQPDLGEEIRKLVSSVQTWTRGVLAEQGLPREHPHELGRTCDWCPLCQFADVVRRDHPEIAEKIADAGAAVSAALRALLEAAGSRSAPVKRDPNRPRPGPGPRVQHIRLDVSDADPGA